MRSSLRSQRSTSIYSLDEYVLFLERVQLMFISSCTNSIIPSTKISRRKQVRFQDSSPSPEDQRNYDHVPQCPHLPLEVLESIADQYRFPRDAIEGLESCYALLSCMLTCKALLPRSRRNLYECITIHPTFNIARLARTLRSGSPSRFNFQPHTLFITAMLSSISILLPPLMTQTQKLHFEFFGQNSTQYWNANAFSAFGHFRSVTQLSLSGIQLRLRGYELSSLY